MKKLFVLILSFILVISMIPVCAVATNDIAPCVEIANCPSRDAASYVNYRSVNNVLYDTPIPGHSELPALSEWDDHLHEYTETYVLCRCTSCGYERKSGYSLYECCDVLNFCYKGYNL